MIEDFFGCSQCDAIDERQRCEHASVQQGYPKIDIICGRRRPQKQWQTDDRKQEHAEGESSPHGAGQILSDLRRIVESDNTDRVNESCDQPVLKVNYFRTNLRIRSTNSPPLLMTASFDYFFLKKNGNTFAS